MKRIILGFTAALALAASAGAADAAVSHIFGKGGQTYTFGDTCRRQTVLEPGVTDHEALNMLGQQVTCLVKRENRMKNCYLRATLSFVNDNRRPEGDWAGVDQLKACGSL